MEGGAKTARAFLDAGFVDEIHLFRSTKPAGGIIINLAGISGWTLLTKTPWTAGEQHGTWDILTP